MQAPGAASRNWIIAAGLAAGFGIWATHFIAMLGYDPGIIVGYKVNLTISSLALVLATTVIAFLVGARAQNFRGTAMASVIAGSGFAAMHYTGMIAIELPAMIRWNFGYVALSLVLAITPLYPAIHLIFRSTKLQSGIIATACITAAVVGLHFSGMTAIDLIPSQNEIEGALLSPFLMSMLVSGATAMLMALCIISWVVVRRSDEAIRQSEKSFGMLVKGISDCAIYMIDTDGRIANWNAGAQRLKGYRVDEVVGQPLARFYTVEDQAAGIPETALNVARNQGVYSGQGWRVRKDGSQFWAHVTIERFLDAKGKMAGFAKITRDMTRFKQDQDRIWEAQQHRDAALEHMHQGLCLFDSDGKLILRNRRFVELWKLPEDSCVPGMAVEGIARLALQSRCGGSVPLDRLEKLNALLERSLKDPNAPPVISEFADGFVVSIASQTMSDGGWVSTFEDISERRKSEARIAHMALHDSLTGLPNRVQFNRWLEQEISIADSRSHKLALVAIDLDGFKEINDSHGHAMGDEVLQSIAMGLSECLKDDEIVSRLGGDEFAVAKLCKDEADLTNLVDRLGGCFSKRQGNDTAAFVSASLGIALYPDDASDRDTLISNADLAMYRAKRSLSEHICYYESGMDEHARHRRQLATDLKQAVALNQLQLLYQPQVKLSDAGISGYEALLRWHHPRLGMVSPLDFIPVAEESGEIIAIGAWVLKTACLEAVRWDKGAKIAVNLSPIQLLRSDLPELVMQTLLETGLPADRLELEITESVIIADKHGALQSLRKIKAMGVSIAIDDFGTGYSSLDTLHSFPFDKIKIDKSFLANAVDRPQTRAIINAVLALGKSLNIPVLAEGVETESQIDLLIAGGCDEAQGYFYGRPSAAESAYAAQAYG